MNKVKKKAMQQNNKSVDIVQAFNILRGQTSPKNKASMPYRQVDIVFSCVEKLLTSIVSRNVPLVLSTVNEEIVEGGPVFDRLYKNPKTPFDQFATDWLGNYILFRDVFIYFDDPINPHSPYEVVSGPLMSEQVNQGTGEVYKWQWSDYGRLRSATPQQVRQRKNFNPYNRYHGTGPLFACDNAIQYCYSLIMRNASAMRNGAEPGVVLETPAGTNLKPEQISAVLGSFDSRYAGPDKTMSTCLLTGGMTAKTLALKMVDLQAAQIDNAQACRIAVTIGVPPQLAGLVTEAQYSGGPAMRDFIFNSAMPYSAIFANVITDEFCQRGYKSDMRTVKYKESKQYNPRCRTLALNKSYMQGRAKALQAGQDVFAWYDWSQHPVVQEAMMEWSAKVLAFTEKGVPLEQVCLAYDLPFDLTDVTWAKDWLVSMGLVPARSIMNGSVNLLEPSLPEGQDEDDPKKHIAKELLADDEKKAEDQKTRIWNKWKNSWRPIEREYQESLRGLFRAQRKELIGKLQAAMNDSKSAKVDTSDIVARVVFDLRKENGKLRVINRVFYEKASKLGAVQTLIETAGLSGDALRDAVKRTQLSDAVRRSLEISSTKITKVNETTQRWVANQLREGLESGDGLTELTARLTSDENRAFSQTRAAAIARTQTAGAVSSGRNAGMKEAGVEKKSWLSARDGNVRPEHKAAEQQYAAGIAIDQPFVVGGERLMYPGDPDGSAAMIANCRCVQLAVIAGGKTFDLDYYDKQKFVSSDEIKTLLSEV